MTWPGLGCAHCGSECERDRVGDRSLHPLVWLHAGCCCKVAACSFRRTETPQCPLTASDRRAGLYLSSAAPSEALLGSCTGPSWARSWAYSLADSAAAWTTVYSFLLGRTRTCGTPAEAVRPCWGSCRPGSQGSAAS